MNTCSNWDSGLPAASFAPSAPRFLPKGRKVPLGTVFLNGKTIFKPVLPAAHMHALCGGHLGWEGEDQHGLDGDPGTCFPELGPAS